MALQETNWRVWDVAARKYVAASAVVLEHARNGGALFRVERGLLGEVRRDGLRVVQLESVHGFETIDVSQRSS